MCALPSPSELVLMPMSFAVERSSRFVSFDFALACNSACWIGHLDPFDPANRVQTHVEVKHAMMIHSCNTAPSVIANLHGAAGCPTITMSLALPAALPAVLARRHYSPLLATRCGNQAAHKVW